MGKSTTKVSDMEQERQRLIGELSADYGPHWAEQYKPGSFGCHELLDRTALVANIVEQYVLTHPACVQNTAWFALAEQAVTALQELYQRIGEVHLADQEPGSAT